MPSARLFFTVPASSPRRDLRLCRHNRAMPPGALRWRSGTVYRYDSAHGLHLRDCVPQDGPRPAPSGLCTPQDCPHLRGGPLLRLSYPPPRQDSLARADQKSREARPGQGRSDRQPEREYFSPGRRCACCFSQRGGIFFPPSISPLLLIVTKVVVTTLPLRGPSLGLPAARILAGVLRPACYLSITRNLSSTPKQSHP